MSSRLIPLESIETWLKSLKQAGVKSVSEQDILQLFAHPSNRALHSIPPTPIVNITTPVIGKKRVASQTDLEIDVVPFKRACVADPNSRTEGPQESSDSESDFEFEAISVDMTKKHLHESSSKLDFTFEREDIEYLIGGGKLDEDEGHGNLKSTGLAKWFWVYLCQAEEVVLIEKFDNDLAGPGGSLGGQKASVTPRDFVARKIERQHGLSFFKSRLVDARSVGRGYELTFENEVGRYQCRSQRAPRLPFVPGVSSYQPHSHHVYKVEHDGKVVEGELIWAGITQVTPREFGWGLMVPEGQGNTSNSRDWSPVCHEDLSNSRGLFVPDGTVFHLVRKPE